VRAVSHGENDDRVSIVVNAVDNAIRTATRREAPLELEPQRLAETPRIGRDRAERLEDRGGDGCRETFDLAAGRSHHPHIP